MLINAKLIFRVFPIRFVIFSLLVLGSIASNPSAAQSADNASPRMRQKYSSVSGLLRSKKQYSYIHFYGEYSGDTLVYFFETNSTVGKYIRSICKVDSQCSGVAAVSAVRTAPQGIPESTSGTFRITDFLPPDYVGEVEINTACGLINADSVNVRENPGMKSRVVDRLNRGDLIRTPRQQSGRDWIRVYALKSGDPAIPYIPFEGYVFKQYVSSCPKK